MKGYAIKCGFKSFVIRSVMYFYHYDEEKEIYLSGRWRIFLEAQLVVPISFVIVTKNYGRTKKKFYKLFHQALEINNLKTLKVE